MHMTLAERARKLREISPVMKGRTKLETRDVTNQELTIIEADLVKEGDEEQYAVVVFKEHPDKFLFGGLVLTSLIAALKAELESEGLILNEELKSSTDPVKIKLIPRKGRTSNRGYTDVEVL